MSHGKNGVWADNREFKASRKLDKTEKMLVSQYFKKRAENQTRKTLHKKSWEQRIAEAKAKHLARKQA